MELKQQIIANMEIDVRFKYYIVQDKSKLVIKDLIKKNNKVRQNQTLFDYQDINGKVISSIKSQYEGIIHFKDQNDKFIEGYIQLCRHSNILDNKCQDCKQKVISQPVSVYIDKEYQGKVRVLNWKQKMQDTVKQGQEICEVVVNDQIYLIKSIQTGKIIFRQEKNNDYQLDNPLYVICKCLHNRIFQQLCQMCNTKIEQSNQDGHSTFAIQGNQRDPIQLKISKEEAQKESVTYSLKLLGNKKLILILDLDNTLLHASIVNQQLQEMNLQDHEIKVIRINQMEYYAVKLRPFLIEFIDSVSRQFNLFIYTMGNRSYAEQIKMILNSELDIYYQKNNLEQPVYQFSNEQIISRDDNFNQDVKQIQRIVPFNEYMVLILDDNEQVWKSSLNLIFTKKYNFFTEQVNQTFLNQYDCYLKFTKCVLSIIYQTFFELIGNKDHHYYLNQEIINPDVRDLYDFYKRNLLSSYTFCFSGFIDQNRPIEQNHFYRKLVQMGGKYQSQVIQDQNQIDFLIINSDSSQTKKFKQAVTNKIPILHVSFIDFCFIYNHCFDFQVFEVHNFSEYYQNNRMNVESIKTDESRNQQQQNNGNDIKQNEIKSDNIQIDEQKTNQNTKQTSLFDFIEKLIKHHYNDRNEILEKYEQKWYLKLVDNFKI